MLSHEQKYLAVKRLVFPPLKITTTLRFVPLNLSSVINWLEQFDSTTVSDKSNQYWLKKFLRFGQNDMIASVDGTERQNGARYQDVVAFAHCISAMSLLMCRQLSCPLFDVPEVLSVDIDPDDSLKIEVVFSLVNIGVVSRTFLNNIFACSYDMCCWLGRQDPQNPSLIRDGLIYFQDAIVPRLNSPKQTLSNTIKLLEAAHKAGIPYCHLGNGTYRLGWGKHASLFYGSVSAHDSYPGIRLAGDKFFVSRLLESAGLSVPIHRDVRNLTTAVEAALSIGFPLVMKPVDSDRGEGVTIDISNVHNIPAAFAKAIHYSRVKSVLVEKQVKGVCHRLFMVNGRLLYAVKRWPPSVFGDGVSSIRQLVEAKMQRELLKLPIDRKPLIPWDQETKSFIQKIGLSEHYVPACSERVALRLIESTEWGGFDEDVTTKVHHDILHQARIASQLLQMSVVGVDVITEDIASPFIETGGVINELNGGPVLGGGDISIAYIPEYLQRLLPRKGKLPIEIFRYCERIEAELLFKEQLNRGVQCYLVSESITIDHHGDEISHNKATFAERLLSLIYNPDVEALFILSDQLMENSLYMSSTTEFQITEGAMLNLGDCKKNKLQTC